MAVFIYMKEIKGDPALTPPCGRSYRKFSEDLYLIGSENVI
jgi:hypothetical protein